MCAVDMYICAIQFVIAFIRNLLMTDYVEHLRIYFVDIFVALMVKYIFKCVVLFNWGFLSFCFNISVI